MVGTLTKIVDKKIEANWFKNMAVLGNWKFVGNQGQSLLEGAIADQAMV